MLQFMYYFYTSMAYVETDFTAEMSSLIKKHGEEYDLDMSFAVEYKTKKAKTRLNFKSDFQPQQIGYLLRAQDQCVYLKLSDIDPSLKPFDALQICHVPSYLIVCWYSPRVYKNVYVISAKTLQKFIEEGNKSLSEQEASSLAVNSFDILGLKSDPCKKPVVVVT